MDDDDVGHVREWSGRWEETFLRHVWVWESWWTSCKSKWTKKIIHFSFTNSIHKYTKFYYRNWDKLNELSHEHCQIESNKPGPPIKKPNRNILVH